MSFTKSPGSHRRALAAILLVALGLRVWGIGFGLPQASARPDETAIAGPAVTFLSGNLEPPYFMYPTGFMYALSGVYVAYYEVTRPWASYKTLADFAESRRRNLAPFLVVSRSISVLFGVLAVFWIYRLGARAADRDVGLLSAGFLAVAFLHVRDSHFGVTDATMTGLVVLTVDWIARWQESGSASMAARAGLAGGLAMGTKYNGLGVVVPFAVAVVDRVAAKWRARTSVIPEVWSSAIFLTILVAVFLAGTFYIFIQPDRFLSDVTAQSRTLQEGHGIALARGWFYHAAVTLPLGLGWPMYIAGVAGSVWWLALHFRRAAVVFAFPAAYYIVAGNGHTVFARYMLPVLPFVCLGAGFAAARFVAMLTAERSDARRRGALVAIAALIAQPTAVKSVELDRLLSRTDNRVVVTGALATILPPDAIVYQSGSSYGRAQWPASIRIHERTFDAATGRFDPNAPDWLLIQRSPLQQYSEIPAGVASLLGTSYELVRPFPVGDGRPRVYDRQDAFFLPLAGLEGLDRPGPTFELYRKK
jgi:hypothetical protein